MFVFAEAREKSLSCSRDARHVCVFLQSLSWAQKILGSLSCAGGKLKYKKVFRGRAKCYNIKTPLLMTIRKSLLMTMRTSLITYMNVFNLKKKTDIESQR